MSPKRIFLPVIVGLAAVFHGSAQAVDLSATEAIKNLKAADEAVRVQAIDRLAVLDATTSADAVLPLAAMLKDSSATVRAHAAHALGEIGGPAIPMTMPLVDATKDSDAMVRRQALRAIVRIRPGSHILMPVCIGALGDSDQATQVCALNAVVEAGPKAVPALIAALKEDAAAYGACLALRDLGESAGAAIPALIEKLEDKRPEIRREAILAIAAMDTSAISVADKIAAMLKDEQVRTAATYALGRIGSIPASAETALQENAKSEDKLLAATSLWTMARVHPKNTTLRAEATEKLIELLKDKNELVRVAAAHALAALPPAPDITLPLWEKAFKDMDEPAIVDALDALATIGAPAVPRLIDALKFEKGREQAAGILARIGPAAAPAVPHLVKFIDDKDIHLAKESIMALAAIGPGAKEAVPALTKSLEHGDSANLPAVAYALGKIGRDAAPAVPVLTKLTRGQDKGLALASAWALTAIEPISPEAATKILQVLTESLKDASPLMRLGAADALGRLGPTAKPALPTLKKVAANDDSREVRAAALKAMRAINPPPKKKPAEAKTKKV